MRILVNAITIFIFLRCSCLLAQPLQVYQVQRLDAINSVAEELMPLLNPKGDTLYFTRVAFDWNVGGSMAGSDIWAASFGSALGKATNNLPPWNNRENNALIGIHNTGNTVYMLDSYGRHEGVAFSRRLRNRWTKPEVINIPGISATGFKGYYMTPDYQVLIISMVADDSQGEEDLYVSIKQQNGKWSKPKNLGATINSSGYEISPFLTADAKRLYFASSGQGGLGNADIFVAERLYDSWDVWSKPINLGSPINSDAFDAYLSVYDTLAFFSSTRQGGLADIYQATLGPASTPASLWPANNLILGESDIVNLFGFIFAPLVEFEPATDVLSAKDKELLWFIANKLVASTDVRIALLGWGNSTKKKAQTVADYLVSLNFPISKLHIEPNVTVLGLNEQQLKAGVNLIFYKAK